MGCGFELVWVFEVILFGVGLIWIAAVDGGLWDGGC